MVNVIQELVEVSVVAKVVEVLVLDDEVMQVKVVVLRW